MPDEVGADPDEVANALDRAEMAAIARDLTLAGVDSWGVYDVAAADWLYVVGTPPPQPAWPHPTLLLVIRGDALSVQDICPTDDMSVKVLEELQAWAMDATRMPFPEPVVGEVLEPGRHDGELAWTYGRRPVVRVGSLAGMRWRPRPSIPPSRD
ncbi:MAG: hypothetical protein R2731_20120 [Nocardioides sp.]